MYKYFIKFSKNGTIKYISHLDLVRLFTRAARRADFPLYLTKGFSPHPKLSFKRALKLGVESNNEEMVLILNDFMETDEFKKKFQAQLPEGIKIREVNLITNE